MIGQFKQYETPFRSLVQWLSLLRLRRLGRCWRTYQNLRLESPFSPSPLLVPTRQTNKTTTTQTNNNNALRSFNPICIKQQIWHSFLFLSHKVRNALTICTQAERKTAKNTQKLIFRKLHYSKKQQNLRKISPTRQLEIVHVTENAWCRPWWADLATDRINNRRTYRG